MPIGISGARSFPGAALFRRLAGRAPRQVANARATVEQLAEKGRRVRPVWKHVSDHGYTVVAIACWDAGWFTHSVFSGLLWTAVTVIAFELKLSLDEDNSNA